MEQARGKHLRWEDTPLRGRHFAPAANEPRKAPRSVGRRRSLQPHPRQQTSHSSRPVPRRRVGTRLHHRRTNPIASALAFLRSPLVMYGIAALMITVVVFVASTPVPVKPAAEPEASSEPKDGESTKPYPTDEAHVEPRDIAHAFEGSSSDAVRASNANGVLSQAIGAFEDTGDDISFAMRDMMTGNTLTYDSGRIQYPASSIKAPYTASVYQQLVESGQTSMEDVFPLAEETIVESSDEAYSELHDRYGSYAFQTWLEEAGVQPLGYESYDEMLNWNYPHLCCDQMLLMWLHLYDYLKSDTEPSHQLADLLERRETSAMREALGTDVRTLSKMGWFDELSDFESEPATVECGVVFADEGTYVVSVMTTAPARIEELVPIFTALARAHYDMI